MNYCSNLGIDLKINDPQPPHLSEAYKYLEYKKGDFPISKRIVDHIVSISIFYSLKDKEVSYIIEYLNNY
ncbi:MAG: DegT/DnrJ/EryC1/StrS family aminotransferase [Bacilli bacterium]|uniref:DegT/DnrJ/EryC1/StrS family aminotransferase n=1 Tax=Anaerorhabdus sp. TaxID=1872524 RepID=UPI003AA73F3C